MINVNKIGCSRPGVTQIWVDASCSSNLMCWLRITDSCIVWRTRRCLRLLQGEIAWCDVFSVVEQSGNTRTDEVIIMKTGHDGWLLLTHCFRCEMVWTRSENFHSTWDTKHYGATSVCLWIRSIRSMLRTRWLVQACVSASPCVYVGFEVLVVDTAKIMKINRERNKSCLRRTSLWNR